MTSKIVSDNEDFEAFNSFHQILNNEAKYFICKDCRLKFNTQIVLLQDKVYLLLKLKRKYSYDLSDSCSDIHTIDVLAMKDSLDNKICLCCNKNKIGKNQSNLEELPIYHNLQEIYEKFMSKNSLYKDNILKEIDTLIQKLNKIQEDILLSFKKNQEINQQLVSYLKYIIELNCDYSKDRGTSALNDLLNVTNFEFNPLTIIKDESENHELARILLLSNTINHNDNIINHEYINNNGYDSQYNKFIEKKENSIHNYFILIEFESKKLIDYYSKNFLIKLGPIECVQTLNYHCNNVNALCNINDDYFCSGSSDNSVNIYETHSFKLVNTIKESKFEITSIEYNSDKKLLIFSNVQGEIIFISLEVIKEPKEIKRLLPIENKAVYSLYFIPNEDPNLRYLCAEYTYSLIFIDINSLNIITKLNLIKSCMFSCSFKFSNGCKLIVALGDCSLHILKGNTLTTDKVIENVGKEGILKIVQYGNDKIIVGLRDNFIRIYDIRTYSLINQIKVYNLYTLIYLKNGQLFTGSNDGFIRMFNIYSNECIFTKSEHKFRVNCFIKLKNGRVVSAGSDNLIKIWW